MGSVTGVVVTGLIVTGLIEGTGSGTNGGLDAGFAISTRHLTVHDVVTACLLLFKVRIQTLNASFFRIHLFDTKLFATEVAVCPVVGLDKAANKVLFPFCNIATSIVEQSLFEIFIASRL